MNFEKQFKFSLDIPQNDLTRKTRSKRQNISDIARWLKPLRNPTLSGFKDKATRRARRRRQNMKIRSAVCALSEKEIAYIFPIPTLSESNSQTNTHTQGFRHNWGYCFIELPLSSPSLCELSFKA